MRLSHGFGAILCQLDDQDQSFHPVYYANWKTSQAESKYSSYELEVLAIIRALNKFRVYLLGIPFKIITDCRAFTLTMNKKGCMYTRCEMGVVTRRIRLYYRT
jgi:hypothetical protein